MSMVRDLPIRQKLYCITGILALNLVILISASVFGLWLLSSLRAYVGGEGLWAKAQKNAIYSLSKYALFQDERDYRDFLDFLKVPQGDRKARLELQKPKPDLAVSDAGFIEGGNHPEDVRNLATLFLRFNRVHYIRKAIGLWERADSAMMGLQKSAEELHGAVSSGKASKKEIQRHLREIDAANDLLTSLENEFSYTLGQASRWAKGMLSLLMLAGSALLGLTSLLAAVMISEQVASGILTVSRAASRVAEGDLSTRIPVAARDELGRLAEAFNHMTEGLAKLDGLKNDFISMVSHELRTPLTLALAPLESLLSGDAAKLSAEQAALLEVAHNNAVRLLQMVSGLLDFSRLEAGKMEVRREPCDVAALSRSIVEDFRPIAANKGQALYLQAEPSELFVQMDRYLYERVLFNLLSNAVKFTPRGGRIIARLSSGGGKIRLSVRDTGIGISKEDQATLFKKFRQIESSSTRRFEGTGLGLALVLEFCQLLGGGVLLDSEPGKGSEFTAEMSASPCSRLEAPSSAAREARRPLPRHSGPAAPEAERPAARGEERQKVLVAEDNPELALYLKGLLSGLCSVRLAHDGEEASRLALEWTPDIVIADVMMPKKDGLALCRELKAAAATAFVPVILLSALTDREAMTRGWEAGADEYLFKPFHPKEVVARVKYMLDSQRARRTAEKDLQAFAYSVAHDLRAPLRKISGFSQLLEARADGRLAAQEREYLGKIQRSILQMGRLIDDMLRLSRITQQEPRAEPLDLSRLAGEIAGELRRSEPERRVDFVIRENVTANGDREFVEIVLRNLLENSWKFTSRRSEATIEFGVAEEGGRKVFFVRDDGAGFAMQYSSKLFGVFQRLHPPGEFPGSGVGLATVRRVVERLGGRVWAQSAPGQGATFYFTLGEAA